jgi:hypothetical protein
MFNRIKTELEKDNKISGDKLYDYLDELKNSKLFRNCQIIIAQYSTLPMLPRWPVDKWTRFKGKIYLHSISWNGGGFYISGEFDHCEFSYDMETAIKLDRLYELDKLDV